MIRFETHNSRAIHYHQTHGMQMLEAMDCSGKIPGALKGDDVATALASLEATVLSKEATTAARAAESENHDSEQHPALFAVRARPLIGLLQAAAANNTYVTWQES